jgi:hypothetical protein
MKRRIANLIVPVLEGILARLEHCELKVTKVYGTFPPEVKTTFRRD